MIMMMKRSTRTSPRSTRRRKKLLHVTFNETARIDEVQSEYKFWYTENDYQRMKEECNSLAEQMSPSLHKDILRSSGLETSESKRERYCTMIDYQWIVLDEQYQLQREKGQKQPNDVNNNPVVTTVKQHDDDDDPLCFDSIATMTSSLTKEHVDDAIKRGIITRQEVLFDDLERQDRQQQSSSRLDNEEHHEEETMMIVRKKHPYLSSSSSESSSSSSLSLPSLRDSILERSWNSINEELGGETGGIMDRTSSASSLSVLEGARAA